MGTRGSFSSNVSFSREVLSAAAKKEEKSTVVLMFPQVVFARACRSITTYILIERTKARIDWRRFHAKLPDHSTNPWSELPTSRFLWV